MGNTCNGILHYLRLWELLLPIKQVSPLKFLVISDTTSELSNFILNFLNLSGISWLPFYMRRKSWELKRTIIVKLFVWAKNMLLVSPVSSFTEVCKNMTLHRHNVPQHSLSCFLPRQIILQLWFVLTLRISSSCRMEVMIGETSSNG
jgi:hypothetical protein